MPPQTNLVAADVEGEVEIEGLPPSPPCNLYSDEPEMETNLHLRQMLLLIMCLEWLWHDRSDYFCSGNLTVYYSEKRIKNRDFRGPDFFVALDVEQKARKSWTVWEEDGKYPDVIVEILSDTTATVDRTTKKDLYQNTFRTPEYFWFDPNTLEFQGFSLNQRVYQPIAANPQGWLWSDCLQLFLGIQADQLRFFLPTGELVPTPQEAAVMAEQQRGAAEQQRLAAEQHALEAEQRALEAEQRADRLAAKLRELAIDPDTL
jgi:Uma2 family endonuclease